MKLKQKIQKLVSPLYNKVWHGPKGKLTAKIKKACDELPRNQRLMVVTILLSAFILTAFFVFGNACYKMGARQAQHEFDIEHIESIELPESRKMTAEEQIAELKSVFGDDFTDAETDVEQLDTTAYETAR